MDAAQGGRIPLWEDPLIRELLRGCSALSTSGDPSRPAVSCSKYYEAEALGKTERVFLDVYVEEVGGEIRGRITRVLVDREGLIPRGDPRGDEWLGGGVALKIIGAGSPPSFEVRVVRCLYEDPELYDGGLRAPCHTLEVRAREAEGLAWCIRNVDYIKEFFEDFLSALGGGSG